MFAVAGCRVSEATPERVAALLSGGSYTTVRSTFGSPVVNEPRVLTSSHRKEYCEEYCVTAPSDPAVLYEIGASVCSMIFSLDTTGTATSIHLDVLTGVGAMGHEAPTSAYLDEHFDRLGYVHPIRSGVLAALGVNRFGFTSSSLRKGQNRVLRGIVSSAVRQARIPHLSVVSMMVEPEAAIADSSHHTSGLVFIPSYVSGSPLHELMLIKGWPTHELLTAYENALFFPTEAS